MIASAAHQLLLNAVLIIITLFALDWRESRWMRRAARRQPSHLRPVRRSALARTHDDAGGQAAVSATRRAS